MARLVADKMQGLLNETLIVDNKPGAGQRIATAELKKAAPDGRTIMLAGNGVFSILPHIYGDALGYDPVKDFAPVSLLASVASVLVSHPSLPVNSMKELIALARAKPNAITYGTAGAGTNPHIAGELLNNLAKIKILAVHYKGGGPAVADLVGGKVHMLFTGAPVTSIPSYGV